MKKPFLSVCMIVKDEEKMLKKNLPSIAEVAEELIIVDTGSTDDTKEVAATFTEHVYDFEWTNSFAAARNFAASKASGEWILALDADERISTNSYTESMKILHKNEGGCSAYVLNITNLSDRGAGYSSSNQMVRVYRNDGSMHYERALHEQLVKIKTGENDVLKLGTLPLEVIHFGYLSAIMAEKNKLERNTKILEQSDDIDKESGFYFYNRAQHFSVEGKYEEALENLIEAHKRLKSNEIAGWLVPCIVMIVNCLINLKRYKDALAVIEDAEIIFEKNPDLPIGRAKIYYAQDRLDDAKDILHTVLTNANNYDEAVSIKGAKDVVPNEMLGKIYEIEKDYQNAMIYYLQGFSLSYTYDLLKKIVTLLLKYHSQEEVFVFARNKKLFEIESFNLVLIQQMLNEGYGILAELLADFVATDDEEFRRALKVKRRIIELDKPVEKLSDILTEEELQKAIKLKFIDVADLCWLHFMTQDDYTKQAFDEISVTMKQNKSQYLLILEKAILLGKDLFVEFLLNEDNYDVNLHPEVADLFFKYGYEDIALNFYQEIDEKNITKQGFKNVIEYLIRNNNLEESNRIGELAINLFEDNFVFYKYVIENTEDNSEFIDRAIKKYQDSTWLQQQLFLADFF